MRYLIILYILFVAAIAHAGTCWEDSGCGSSGSTPWTVKASNGGADSCERADVNCCLSESSLGDTINVPAGNCSWSSGITITGRNLIGAGKDGSGTNITPTSSWDFTFTTNASYQTKMEGFKVSWSNNSNTVTIQANVGTNGVSHEPLIIEDIKLEYTGSGIDTDNSRINCARGVMANCDFIDVGQEAFHITCDPNHEWITDPGPVNFGSDEFFFIEDCTFDHDTFLSASHGIMTDGGGKSVTRYTTFDGGLDVDSHGYCTGGAANDSGTRATEIYKNAWDMDVSGSHPFAVNFRGGPGYIWGNDVSESVGTMNYIVHFLEYQVEYKDPCGTVCGTNGCPDTYPAPQQIGWDLDEGGAYLDYTDYSIRPIYMWDNDVLAGSVDEYIIKDPGAGCCYPPYNNAYHVQSGREFYSAGDGDVSEGLWESRPGTCSEGDGHWATDMGGDWNKKVPNTSGQDGALYVCNDSNTWVINYTPYTYPHPLREEGQDFVTATTAGTGLSGGSRQ